MDRTDVEIDEYEEIVGDLERYLDRAETEEAGSVSIQQPTLSDQGNLMTRIERPTLRPVHEKLASSSTESHPVVVTVFGTKLREPPPISANLCATAYKWSAMISILDVPRCRLSTILHTADGLSPPLAQQHGTLETWSYKEQYINYRTIYLGVY